MPTLSITLTPEASEKLLLRAQQCGFQRIEEYVESLVESELKDDFADDPEFEQLLLRRLEDPSTTELTPTFVEEFKSRIAQRRSERAEQK